MRITEILAEAWSQKYKSSINCSHPRGFSQKAHCAGKKKHNESVEMEMVCEDCGMCQTHGSLNEIKKGQKDANGYTKCWPGKHAEGTKKGRNGGQVRNCKPNKNINEFATGRGGNGSGRWYTDDEITELVGDGWWEEMDISGASIGVPDGDLPKEYMMHQAQAWLDDQGYNVEVHNIRLNDDDCDWFIIGDFYNPGFAKKGVHEAATAAQQAAIAIAKKKKKDMAEASKHGLYYNVNKRKAAGTSRPANNPKAPTAQAWKDAAKTAKKESVAEGAFDIFKKLPPSGSTVKIAGRPVEISYGSHGGEDNSHVNFSWNDTNGKEHYVEARVETITNLRALAKRIKSEMDWVEQQNAKQGVAETISTASRARNAAARDYETDLLNKDNEWKQTWLQKTIDFASKTGFQIKTNPSRTKAIFINKQLGFGLQAMIKNHRDDGLTVRYGDLDGKDNFNIDLAPDEFHDTFIRLYKDAKNGRVDQGHKFPTQNQFDPDEPEQKYLRSFLEQGVAEDLDAQFDAIEEMVEAFAQRHGVDADVIWEDFESVDDSELLDESAAWRRKEGKSKKGGLNAKGVASYRRENPGSKLQTAVTTKPSKLKAGSKAAKRRKSFCARMGGVKGPMKKPNGKPTRKALALRKWNC